MTKIYNGSERFTASSFVITGYGRVGTKYLSSQLTRVPGWRVTHEPRGVDDLAIRDPAGVENSGLHVFFKEARRYGEVNSGLKFCLPYLPVDGRGIILRCPKEVFLSVCNRREVIPLSEPDFIFREYSRFIRWSRRFGVSLVSFRRMIESDLYLDEICNCFIGSCPKIKWSRSKININTKMAFGDFYDLPAVAIDSFNQHDWGEIAAVLGEVDAASKPISYGER